MPTPIRPACVASLLVLTACGQPQKPDLKVGAFYTVQFRRDALGMGGASPAPPNSLAFNGAETQVTGMLRHVDASWIVLESKNIVLFIPMSAVLLISQTEPVRQ